jgi:hypothetical protein
MWIMRELNTLIHSKSNIELGNKRYCNAPTILSEKEVPKNLLNGPEADMGGLIGLA